MRIDVEDVWNNIDERTRFNWHKLKDIKFFRDNKEVIIPEEEIKEFEITGLSNIDFVMSREWPE